MVLQKQSFYIGITHTIKDRSFDVIFTAKPYQTHGCDWCVPGCHTGLPHAASWGRQPCCFQATGFCWKHRSIDHFDSCWLPITDQRWPVALQKVVAEIHCRFVSCPGIISSVGVFSNQTRYHSGHFIWCGRCLYYVFVVTFAGTVH